MEDARRDAARVADAAARTSYGRLLSILAARSGDIAAAEDALAEAFAAALAQWPRDGVPANPAGWLLTAARRNVGHAAGRRRTAAKAADVLRLLQDERDASGPNAPGPGALGSGALGPGAPGSGATGACASGPRAFGDERLALMFVCAHPAIDAEAQAPLMLQAVLGLDAARIAACFLVSAATMGQRLVRAKRKIREAGIAFAIPEPAEAPARVDGVLSAVYAAYGTAWEDMTGAEDRLLGLASEAIWFACLLRELLPADPEVMGLLSLMLHCEARRDARRDHNGDFVPLDRQNTALWSRPMIAQAEALLREAAPMARPGRFQTEAAIQSLHAHQRVTGERFTKPLAQLYDALARFAPTTGILVARAVACAENGDPSAGLRQLDAISAAGTYQPWWAARARIGWLAGDEASARAAAATAAGLSSDPSVRRFLLDGGYRRAP